MSLENKMKESYKNLKAPKGMFAVCVWNPSNPEKSIPKQVGSPYIVEGFAIGYAKRMNAKEQPAIGEAAYFVVNEKGVRVY